MATHSSCSCLENPMDRGAWWATQSIGSQRVRYDLATTPSPPRNRIAGSRDSSIFKFWATFHYIFQCGCRVSFLHIVTSIYLLIFDNSHPHHCERSHYGFGLPCPDDSDDSIFSCTSWVFVYLYGEISTHFFYLFLIISVFFFFFCY